MAAIDGVGETHPQMPLNASMSRLRAGEIDMVVGGTGFTVRKPESFRQKCLMLDA